MEGINQYLISSISVLKNEVPIMSEPEINDQSEEEKSLELFIKKMKHSWEVEGKKMFESKEKKIMFTSKEKSIAMSLLLKPFPLKHRKKLWIFSLGAKREQINNPGYYQSLTTNYPKSSILSPFEMQISLDLKRTFPEDVFFKSPENLKKLENILLAYSRRNSTIGYTQGFNFIVGRILKEVLDEVS